MLCRPDVLHTCTTNILRKTGRVVSAASGAVGERSSQLCSPSVQPCRVGEGSTLLRSLLTASRSTFKRVFAKYFSNLLVFHPYMKHAACNTCCDLTLPIRTADTPQQRAAWVHALNKHSRGFMVYRHFYYKMRGLSGQSDMFAIMQDGSDQASTA